MNVENTKSQMRKGMLEYCILLLLNKRACYANEAPKDLHANITPSQLMARKL